jgi:hypothetical protein
MSGGAVCGNSASSNGGGVYVAGNGTFTMSGGAVSGNSISTYDGGAPGPYGGGGVYVDGTFTMSGGAVTGNILSGTGNRYGKEVLLFYGTFKISGNAQPERVFLYNNSQFITITISGPLSGGTVPIDLGVSSNYGSGSLTGWINKQILQLDTTYSSGNLASLKTHFTLNSQMISSPWTGESLTFSYEINNYGCFVERW